MPTTVVKTIGSGIGRDYSTLQAWNDAAPANLVTSDEIWQGQLYNDSEFVSSSTLLIASGSVTDATHYKELTVAIGQSFQDNAGVRTNPLTYNISNGVGIRSTNGFGNEPIQINEQYFRLSRVQLKSTGSPIGINVGGGGSGDNLLLKDIIAYGSNAFGEDPGLSASIGNNCTLVNIIMIQSGSADDGFRIGGSGNKLIGCCAIRLTDNVSAGNAVNQLFAGSNTFTTTSCAFFGFSTICPAGGMDAGSKNNATNLASFPAGTSNQTSVTFNATTPFRQATASGADLRAIASTNLAANGFLDAINAPNDISKLARPSNPTIGVWQLASSGGGKSTGSRYREGNRSNWNR